MRALLLGCAAPLAAIAVAAPAEAQRWTDPGFAAAANVTVHRGDSGRFVEFRREHRRDFGCGPLARRGDGRRGHHRSGDCVVFGGPLGYYGDYDANRSFDPDRWNDWWHDRPSRAYPRWVQNNEGCAPDRMWQGGGQWRCSW